jgi:hypothetical protein
MLIVAIVVAIVVAVCFRGSSFGEQPTAKNQHYC